MPIDLKTLHYSPHKHTLLHEKLASGKYNVALPVETIKSIGHPNRLERKIAQATWGMDFLYDELSKVNAQRQQLGQAPIQIDCIPTIAYGKINRAANLEEYEEQLAGIFRMEFGLFDKNEPQVAYLHEAVEYATAHLSREKQQRWNAGKLSESYETSRRLLQDIIKIHKTTGTPLSLLLNWRYKKSPLREKYNQPSRRKRESNEDEKDHFRFYKSALGNLNGLLFNYKVGIVIAHRCHNRSVFLQKFTNPSASRSGRIRAHRSGTDTKKDKLKKESEFDLILLTTRKELHRFVNEVERPVDQSGLEIICHNKLLLPR